MNICTDISTLLSEEREFFPGVTKASKFSLVVALVTCSIERSFSTLRKIKDYLRSMMTENCLSGLRFHLKAPVKNLLNKVLNNFSQDGRRLKLLYFNKFIINLFHSERISSVLIFIFFVVYIVEHFIVLYPNLGYVIIIIKKHNKYTLYIIFTFYWNFFRGVDVTGYWIFKRESARFFV